MKTWNKERIRTRDRLLEYDFNIVPPHPHSAGLPIIYPWENINLNQLKKQLYTIAASTGFEGTEQDFNTKFGQFFSKKQIIFDSFTNFPISGDENQFYFDLIEKILYYWDNEYIPVNAMLIANTILDGGNALEEI